MDTRRLFLWINSDLPDLQPVQKAAAEGRFDEAYVMLRDYYMKRTVPPMYFLDEELEQLTAYVDAYCPHELELAMKTADEVVENIFVFRFPWDMERTNVPVRFDGDIDWNHIPAQDEEWAYMLNRHRYWIALGQAYAVTKDEKYAEAFCRQLDDWIERNPAPPSPTRATLTWRTIEAGLRCENWIEAFQYMKKSPHFTPQLFAKMLCSLHEHGQYIAAGFDGWKSISNWGVLENHGLFSLSVFAQEFLCAASWRVLSMERLKETARMQVRQDGMHWEQSPMYHNEVLHCYLDSLIIARNHGIKLDASIVDTAYKMLKADLYLAKPNHRQPMHGDSDDNDLRDLLTAGAVYFEETTFKYGGYPRLDYDNAWNYGMNGVRMYEKLAACVPDHTSHPFVNTGNFVMRSDWSEKAAYLLFHCGFLGGGHGHADLLHFDLHAYGRDLLVDSGRYSYSDSMELRRALKECSGHNTTTVDGVPFTEYITTWVNGRIAEPKGAQWLSAPAFDYVEGSHTGYRHLEDPVHPLRRILFVKTGYWLLSDSFDCTQEHMFRQHFHFAPGEIVLEEGGLSCRTQSLTEANLRIIPVHPERLTADVQDSWISYEYNRAEPNKSITYLSIGQGFTSMLHVLYPQQPGDAACPVVERVEVRTYTGDIVSDAAAEAVRIRWEHGEEHVILICHQTPSCHIHAYVVDGIQVFGEVVLMKKSAGQVELHVIK